MSAIGSLGTIAADDRVGVPGRLGQLLQLRGLGGRSAARSPRRRARTSRRSSSTTRRSTSAGRTAGTSPRCRPCRARAGRRGTGTTRRVPGPTGGCARRRCVRSVRPSSLLLADRGERPADHLAERAVDPAGDGRAAERDRARRDAGGCAARTTRGRRRAPRPTARRRRHRTPGGRRSRDRRSRRASALSTRERERVDPIGGRRVRRPGQLRGGLRPAAPTGGRRVDDVTTRTGRSAAAA